MPPKSKLLNDVLSRTPDKTLYHYTTQSGLLGILREKEIWATHTQYLNDSKEYRHATELIGLIIDQRIESASKNSQLIWDDMAQGIREIESMNVCVCSFSEERDSLCNGAPMGILHLAMR